VRIRRLKDDAFVVHLANHELKMLERILELYPVVPFSYARLSRTGTPSPAHAQSQQLLEEALAEHRDGNRRALKEWLARPGRIQHETGGCLLSLSASEIDRLLQILNDVRVGSWIRMGSPEGRVRKLTKETAEHLWAMEMSGYFQMHLLEALEKTES
jgi:hypothetical protein